MGTTTVNFDNQTVQVQAGENTAEAARQATTATTAANSAAAAGNYYTSQAAGEAATSTGDFFSYPDGSGGLVYAERTGGGSSVIANAATSAQLATKADASELIDLTSIRTITSGTALGTADLNTMIVLGNNASAYTVNLPSVGGGDVGAALKMEVARTCLVPVAIQAATGTIDGLAEIILMSGETATFWYDGSTWRMIEYKRIPIIAEMLNSAATAFTSTSFTDIPMSTAGSQLMRADLKDTWDYSSGYFEAARSMNLRCEIDFFATPAGGAGSFDIGFYTAATGGGSPASKNFSRFYSAANTLQKWHCTTVLRVSKGNKVFPSIRLIAPHTSFTQNNSSALSRLTITELSE